MLDLDSLRWSELRQAYGSAEDVPELLTSLDDDDAALDDLIGALCHQGSVYSASYAAVPHLVAQAGRAASADRSADILILVGSIRASSDYRGAQPLLADIQDAYESTLPEALKLSLATLPKLTDPGRAIYLLQAACALKGYLGPGRCLSGFLDEEFSPECPDCGEQLYVWPSGAGLSVAAADPVTDPLTERTPVTPGPSQGSQSETEYRWILDAAGPAALRVLGKRLACLYGEGTCPACGCVFSMMDELVRQGP